MIDVLAALPTPSFPSITSVLFPIRPSSLYPSSHPQFRSILLFNNIKGVFGCSGSGCVLSRFCTKTYIFSKGSLGEKAAVPGGSRRFQAGSRSKTHPDPCQNKTFSNRFWGRIHQSFCSHVRDMWIKHSIVPSHERIALCACKMPQEPLFASKKMSANQQTKKESPKKAP